MELKEGEGGGGGGFIPARKRHPKVRSDSGSKFYIFFFLRAEPTGQHTFLFDSAIDTALLSTGSSDHSLRFGLRAGPATLGDALLP